MSTRDSGGPAFPQERTLPCGSHEECEGMTLRDYFAAKAMQAYLTAPDTGFGFGELSRAAYEQADAMLKARK